MSTSGLLNQGKTVRHQDIEPSLIKSADQIPHLITGCDVEPDINRNSPGIQFSELSYKPFFFLNLRIRSIRMLPARYPITPP